MRNFRGARSLEPLLFGVGNSDHQCEAFDPRFADIRDIWEQGRGLVQRGRATDFWNRYPEDIELARSMGCRIFRFSVSWARVEPEAGKFNEEAILHYREVVQAIKGAGMEPLVTLHHFTWPTHIEDQGGMEAPGFPALFVRYATMVASRIGPDVQYWITFNEPTVALFGYFKPWWERNYFFPPGLPPGLSISAQMDTLAAVIRNLFVAHTRARAAIRQINPHAMVGSNPAILGLPPWLLRFLDWMMTRVKSQKALLKHGRRLSERMLPLSRNVDIVLAALTRTEDRAEQIDFSRAYLVSGQTAIGRAAAADRLAEAVAVKTVAVVRSSTAENAVETMFPGARALLVKSLDAARVAVDTRRADALITDTLIVSGILRRFPGRYRVVAERPTREHYAAGVLKGNADWLGLVEEVMRAYMQSSAWTDGLRRHFPGEQAQEQPDADANATLADMGPGRGRQDSSAGQTALPKGRAGSVLRRVQDRGFLTAAVRDDLPGLGFRDPATGEWAGIEIDLARALARRIFGDPSRVRLRPVQTRARIPLLRSLFQFLDPLFKFLSILSSAIDSNWWHLGMAGRLADFLCPAECIGQQDFVGFDYYWGVGTLRVSRLKNLFDALMHGRYAKAPVWTGGLRNILRSHGAMFPGKPIMIIENGSVDEADGVGREDYVRRHVAEVQRARRAGINVRAYLCWSITSNREWGAVFARDCDFGLYHVDLDSDPGLARRPTKAVEAYKDIIRGAGQSTDGSAAPPDAS